jgi:hypothetical protein
MNRQEAVEDVRSHLKVAIEQRMESIKDSEFSKFLGLSEPSQKKLNRAAAAAVNALLTPDE